MRTDTRPGHGPSLPRWRVPGLLGAALAASVGVALAVPSWTPTTPPQVATAAAATAAAAAGTGAVPAGPATVVPVATGPSVPAVTAPDGTPVARPATGALFDGPAEDPGDHFCSASVVESATGDLVVTAAHCVADGDGTPARTGMSFAPGYDDGTAPFGYWTVTAAAVPPGWLESGDPDSDVAFLTVSRPDAPPIQQVTGAYRLAFGASGTGDDDTPVTAVGYNDGDEDATTVSGTAGTLDEDQWQLDQPGLDQGSSGGPWLTGPDDSEILAVTGGYQQGGDSPDVSYGADLGPAVQSAYRSAGGTD
ncbi:serine protease [Pseudonocardia sp. DR1-2]|uniref:trypsin-like serine peptidase n=1 Tax=Pseudonocardia sp. DR1-2 TaxID=2951168 RepID=UPI002044BFE9|nr:serine protease [Pseudonocardia sp. DR1-2]MCM3847016.1 serine protease [Pseudonocardia sp. DR1-2]